MGVNDKYFLYSSAQAEKEKMLCKKIGRKYRPLSVVANGKIREYTEMVDDPKNSNYADSIIVVFGDIRGMTYTSR